VAETTQEINTKGRATKKKNSDLHIITLASKSKQEQ